MIAGVVLAAGASRRFADGRGAQKLVAPAAGKPVVRWTVERVLASRVDHVVVVTGYERDAVKSALSNLHVRIAHNPNFARGLGASLEAGIAALPAAVTGAIIVLGDQPTVSTAVIDKLVDVWHERRMPIVAPLYRGVRGNPVLFAASVFHELRAVGGDHGARDIITRSPERVTLLDVDAEMPLDVDDRASLDAVSRALAADPATTGSP
ncbi:MAG TPA: nucleotidyltransferase family protein [Gemmatimonadaceae bacterium]|nr:nucleotidyltransferase family protein [Gemmatimonadaceae bacterium]